jgi:predicted MFS family arabinose efflux permease
VIYALLRLPARQRTTAQAVPRIAEAERSLWLDMATGLRFVFHHPGLRRLSIMLGLFMFLAAPLQGLLAVYVQQVLHGESRLYGILLGAIGMGAFCGALTIGRIPSYYPRHHLIPLGMCLTCVFILVFTLAHSAAVAFPILFVIGYFWMISLNSTNAANQLLATEENRGRVLSVMLLFTQGATPLGHLAAAGLTHLMSPPAVIRSMVGTLLVVCVGFLLRREPAIDEMPPQPEQPNTLFGAVWEAVTAQSHRPVPQDLRTEMAGESAAAADANPRSL